MFRTVSVYKGEYIYLNQGWMVVKSESSESKIPIEDIYSVIIDNRQTNLSVPVLTALTASGAHILICNEKHLPTTLILPQDIHYHPLTVIKRQIDMPDDIKDKLWDKIITAKIQNQAEVIKLCIGKTEKYQRLSELSREVINGDEGNREGIAAKMFFRELF